jgi:hypothetical protein
MASQVRPRACLALVYALTDQERSIYDTVRGIDWLLADKK